MDTTYNETRNAVRRHPLIVRPLNNISRSELKPETAIDGKQ
jgi:hypothetical protein